jgi:hypothetical protein
MPCHATHGAPVRGMYRRFREGRCAIRTLVLSSPCKHRMHACMHAPRDDDSNNARGRRDCLRLRRSGSGGLAFLIMGRGCIACTDDAQHTAQHIHTVQTDPYRLVVGYSPALHCDCSRSCVPFLIWCAYTCSLLFTPHMYTLLAATGVLCCVLW